MSIMRPVWYKSSEVPERTSRVSCDSSAIAFVELSGAEERKPPLLMLPGLPCQTLGLWCLETVSFSLLSS